MTASELFDFLLTIQDKEQEVLLVNVFGELQSIDHIQNEDGKIVIY